MTEKTSKKSQTVRLEDSEMWQLAKVITAAVRTTVKNVPYQEFYVFASPAIQTAVTMTSDIAHAAGKADEDTSTDYRYARGRLFTLKSLLIMANELGFVENTKGVLSDIEKLHKLLEKELTQLDKQEEARA